MIRNQLLRVRVDFLPNSKQRGTTPCIVGRMRPALILGQLQKSGVPSVAPQTSIVIDWKAEIVANLGTGNPLGFILVETVVPKAGGILLCGNGASEFRQ